jgi:hypothetical protein
MCKGFKFYLGMQNNEFLIKGIMRKVLWPIIYLTSRPRLWTVRVSSRLDTFKLNSLPNVAPFSSNIRFGNILRATKFLDQKLRFPFRRVYYKPRPSHRLWVIDYLVASKQIVHIMKYSVIKKDDLKVVRLYFLNYTWYVNDLNSIRNRRS